MSNNKMLVDASHPEETRVVVQRGNRIEEFDFESANKKPLRGNIYLAKVTRVEPSLQAAFVDYGGNRHGFLAFSEIHPDYYQIPVADRIALLEEEAREQREEAAEEENRSVRRNHRRRRGNGRQARRSSGDDETITADAPPDEADSSDAPQADQQQAGHIDPAAPDAIGLVSGDAEPAVPHGDEIQDAQNPEQSPVNADHEQDRQRAIAMSGPGQDTGVPAVTQETDALPAHSGSEDARSKDASADEPGQQDTVSAATGDDALTAPVTASAPLAGPADEPSTARSPDDADDDVPGEGEEAPDDASDEDDASDNEDEDESVEQLGGDSEEDMPRAARRSRRQYKIQEVIKRRQIMLIQVVKEERGNKGAALTTYLSLAGRYSVLMPNTARGGGISRKITDGDDRRRMKEIAQDLEVPEGMGVILRTAGASRNKQEIKRDFEYLLRLWESVREMTLGSTAPTLVYEEGSLIKRSIRDLYGKEFDEIVVAGDEGYKEAKDFMRMLMPSHIKNVKQWREPQPIFAKSGVEQQLDALFSPAVTMKSGGYIVINQTEALVAIDVNSGRSTREHNIEDTALRTNLEAADEISRQLRLRDLAGLIVVDFIDMEEHRNNRAVERRLKEALKNDRARIQVGRISHFGLLEMSRQRMRTGVLEGSSIVCPHCQGSGNVRSTASIALHVLRLIEDALIRNNSFDLIVKTRSEVALYILNQKRAHLSELEQRFGVTLTVDADDHMTGTTYHSIERGEPASAPVIAPSQALSFQSPADEQSPDHEEEDAPAPATELPDDSEPAPRPAAGEENEVSEDNEAEQKRRRRRRRRGRDRTPSGISAEAPQPSDDGLAFMAQEKSPTSSGNAPADSDDTAADTSAQDSSVHANENDRSRRSRSGFRRRHPNSADETADRNATGYDVESAQNHAELADTGNAGPEGEPAGDETPSAPRSGTWIKASEDRGSRRRRGKPDQEPASYPFAAPAAASATPEPEHPQPVEAAEDSATPHAMGIAAAATSSSLETKFAAMAQPDESPSDEANDTPPQIVPPPEPLPEAVPPPVKKSGWWNRGEI